MYTYIYIYIGCLQTFMLKLDLTTTVEHVFSMYFVSQDAVNMQDVLHNDENEENAEDECEVVDMDDGDHVFLWLSGKELR